MKPIKLKMKAFGSYAKETVVEFARFRRGLFLITGDTGAGKTTIFDAIVFALYGTFSGSERAMEMMHCDYVSRGEDTSVTFSFEQNGKVYVAERTIHFRKKRGTEDEYGSAMPNAVLTLPEGDPIKGAEKVTRRVEQILGLNADQFRQIVMLAQGDFKKFLKADSNKKSEILGKLFDNSLYIRYRELIVEAAQLLKNERQKSYDEIHIAMERIFIAPEANGEFDSELWLAGNLQLEENLLNLIEQEKAENENLEKQRSGEFNNLQSLVSSIQKANTDNNLLNELQEKQRHHKELKGESEKYAKVEERVKAVAEVSRKIMPVLRRRREAENELNSLKQQISDKNGELISSQEEMNKAEDAVKADAQNIEKAEKLGKEIQRLTDSITSYVDLEQKRTDIEIREESIRNDTLELEEKIKPTRSS